MRQALLISIWQLSAILLLTSSPLKLCQVGWGQTHIFRFLQKYLIGFKLRLWLGHSRTFTELSISHSCSVFRSIVLLEGKASAQVLNALNWVLIKALSIFWMLVHWAFLLLWPCRRKTTPKHEAATSTLYFWDGNLYVMQSTIPNDRDSWYFFWPYHPALYMSKYIYIYFFFFFFFFVRNLSNQFSEPLKQNKNNNNCINPFDLKYIRFILIF